MALSNDVQARIPAAILVQLTNPRGGSAPNSVGESLLSQACDDVEAYFNTYAEEVYDSSVSIHVAVAVRGVEGLLRLYGSGHYTGSKEFWADFQSECDRIKATRSRARIQPYTNSQLTPSTENETGGTKRPWSDDKAWAGHEPRRYGSDTEE